LKAARRESIERLSERSNLHASHTKTVVAQWFAIVTSIAHELRHSNDLRRGQRAYTFYASKHRWLADEGVNPREKL